VEEFLIFEVFMVEEFLLFHRGGIPCTGIIVDNGKRQRNYIVEKFLLKSSTNRLSLRHKIDTRRLKQELTGVI
jgi:hypothetical protein